MKEKVDGIWGKLIDLVAIFALIAGTATTFSLADTIAVQCIVLRIPVAEKQQNYGTHITCHCSNLYGDSMVWNERRFQTFGQLFLFVLGIACLCIAWGRRVHLYT